MTRWVAMLAMAGLLLLGGPAQAQFGKKKDADANIRSVHGVVTDAADNPISGAIVQIKNTKTLQIRSFITKEKGDYYFGELNTDVDYHIHAENHGMVSASRTLSSFDNRKEAILNFKVDQEKKK